MKLGLFTVLYADYSLSQIIELVESLGIHSLEIGVENYPKTSQLDEFTTDAEIGTLLEKLERHNIEISALSCQGNPLHPQADIAEHHHQGWRTTTAWARRLGVKHINVFSGCPGTPGGGSHPNWVTTAWPSEYRELLQWQWDEKVIPYWTKEVEFADKLGITQIAYEMHPGFVVYNPETLLRLRHAIGDNIGANLDPSHLFWQGIDPSATVRLLASENALFHVHAKDVLIDAQQIAVNGVLDTHSYADAKNRRWNFCTIGYGHSPGVWAEFIQTLRRFGYDGVLSIEHEDLLASRNEGLRHAVNFLENLLWTEPAPEAWWL